MKYLTFILGAGASMPYGFPDGATLVQRIIGEANDFMGTWSNDVYHANRRQIQNQEILKELEACWAYLLNERKNANLTREEIQKLAERIHEELKLYRPISIDSYLSNLYNADVPNGKLYVDLCKYYICKIIGSKYLLNYESQTAKKEDDRWVHYLFNTILYYFHRHKYEVDELPIKIITFNYDTFLEQHFRKWMVTTQLLDESKKQKVIDLFCKSICHVYGQIGYVAYKRDHREQSSPIAAPTDVGPDEIIWTADIQDTNFKRTVLQNLALKSIPRIHLISRQHSGDEDKEGDCASQPSLDMAQKWLKNTETLIISGYAFDEDNNNRLNLKELLKNIPQIYGTLKDAGLSLKEDVYELISQVLSPPKSKQATQQTLRPIKYFRHVRFDGNVFAPPQTSEGMHDVRHRTGFFAKFYDDTTHKLLHKELNLNSLSRKLWPK